MKSFVLMAAIAVTVATISPSNATTEDTDKPGSIARLNREHQNWVNHTALHRRSTARTKQAQVAKAKARAASVANAKSAKVAVKQAKPQQNESSPLGPDPSPTPIATNLVAEARRYIGSGPVFGRKTLWCGRFMDTVLRRTGHKGGGDLASAYASYGRRISGPQVGAIAVMSRGRGGGHVGVVTGVTKEGNIKIISGNHNNRVAESVYPRGRIYAYVMPGA